MKKLTFTFLSLFFFVFSIQAQTISERQIVKLSAAIDVNPASVTIAWEPVDGAIGYGIYKKQFGIVDWGAPTTIPPNVNAITDTDVTLPSLWEYRIIAVRADTTSAIGHISVSVRITTPDDRGGILLVVDSTFKTSLATEITQLEYDLAGEGHTVYRLDVDRNDTPTNVKTQIQAMKTAHDEINYMYLLGHVPVPYTGNFADSAPDGHVDHEGAWPSDNYYAVLGGNWTDNIVNNTTATRAANHNVPGDGKFDNTGFPAAIDLYTGRVDFANLPAFAESEEELLRKYLNKSHEYKFRELIPSETAIIDDNFQNLPEGFARNGWGNFGPLVGLDNISAGDYFTELEATPHLWSYGCGPGNYNRATGVGTTDDFASKNPQGIFTMLFGSYFGDWDSENNFLRAALASGNTLANIWSGRPHSYLHWMGVGEPIGTAFWVSQMNPGLRDNAGNPVYNPTGAFAGGLHQSLMGDPTLKNRYSATVTDATASFNGGDLEISWTPLVDPQVIGYFVYTSNNPRGPFQQITPDPVAGPSVTVECLPDGDTYYMVRSIRIEVTPSGQYFNFGLGEILKADPVPALTIDITPISPSCSGSVDASASVFVTNGTPPLTYEWSNGANTATIAPIRAGTYEVTVTDDCQKTTTGTVTITEPDPIVINLTTTDETGSNKLDGTATVAPTGGAPPYTISWAIGMANMNPLTGISPGPHSVTITDANGCESSESFVINEYACPTIVSDAVVTAPDCFGEMGSVVINLTGAEMPVTYDLNSPGDYVAGTYQYSGTDANGCNFGGLFVIPEPSLILPNLMTSNETGPNQNDGSATVAPSGGTPPYTVIWSNGQTGNMAINLAPGDYINEITDANGCTVETTFTINDASCNLDTAVDVENPDCTGEQGTVTIIVTGGTAPYTFTSNGSGMYGAGDYQFAGTDANGCGFAGSFTVTEPSALVVTEQITDATCPNSNDGWIMLTVGGGAMPYNVTWSNGATGMVVQGLSGGQIEATVTDGNGCTFTTTYTVNSEDGTAPTITAQGVTISLDMMGNASISPNDLNVVGTDNCGSNLTYTIDNQTFDCSHLGDNLVTVTATDESGNVSSIDAIVTVVDDVAPLLNCPSDMTVNACEMAVDYTMPTATDNCSATLDLTSGLASGATFMAGTTEVVYTATDASGNTASCSFSVALMSDLAISNLDYTDLLTCTDTIGSATVDVTGGTNPTITWSTGATGTTITYANGGTYSVTVSENGCELVRDFVVVESSSTPQLNVSTTDDDGSGNGSIAIDAITGGVSPFIILVFDSNGNSVPPSGNPPAFLNLGAGTYSVTVTDANGCSDSVLVTIGVVNSVDNKIFPGTFNAFPNPTSDYLNLEISLNKGADFNWKIYDGRGQLMQESASRLQNTLLKKLMFLSLPAAFIC